MHFCAAPAISPLIPVSRSHTREFRRPYPAPRRGEISARRAEGRIAFIEDGHAATSSGQSPGNRSAYEAAADDSKIEFVLADSLILDVLGGPEAIRLG